MKRTANKAPFEKWVVWNVWRESGYFFDTIEEASEYANATGGILEYVGTVYPV